MSEKFIYTDKLTKIYTTSKGKNRIETKALSDVNLEIEKGEMVAIIGASGSGKSTLLHMLGGIDIPTSGSVFYGKENIFAMNDKKLSAFRREKTGFVFQFFNLFQELTVKQNIMVPMQLQKKKADKKRVLELAESLGIKEKLSAFPEQLSGGQQQRVAIARALVNQPDLLLCDEPTGNLDEKTGQEVMELLLEAKEKWGQTIVLVTHNKEIANQADRIFQMKDGVLEEMTGVN